MRANHVLRPLARFGKVTNDDGVSSAIPQRDLLDFLCKMLHA